MYSPKSVFEYIEADVSIDIIDAVFRFTTENSNWSYNPGTVPYNMVVYILKGEGVFYFDEETVFVHPNELLFIPQGKKFHSRGIKNSFDYFCFQFYSSDMDGAFPFKKRYPVESPGFFIQLFEEMFDNWLTKKAGYKFRIKSIAYQIFYQVLNRDVYTNENMKAVNIINKSLAYMRRNYYNPALTIEDIAEQSNITSAHFRNLFKSIYSVSPLKHINKMRILRAAQLLEYTTMPINKIGLTVGFSNAYHFNKLFKNIMGSSPGSYRRETRHD